MSTRAFLYFHKCDIGAGDVRPAIAEADESYATKITTMRGVACMVDIRAQIGGKVRRRAGGGESPVGRLAEKAHPYIQKE